MSMESKQIKVAVRATGPEAGEHGFLEEVRLLRDALQVRALTDQSPALMHFFFEVEGRFSSGLVKRDFSTRVGRSIVYNDGHCSIDIEISLETLQLPYGSRREIVCDLLCEGAEKLSMKVREKWPQFNAGDYLEAVHQGCARYRAFPTPDGS